MLNALTKELQFQANKEKAEFLARYFKTGPGEYGEGDIFLGLTVPQVRAVAKKYRDVPLGDVAELLHNKIHEYRLTALLILVAKFEKGDEKEKKKIVDFYLANTRYINNWDLVDLSAHEILGEYLLANPKERKILKTLAKSKNIWERRIAVISTYTLLRQKEFVETFAIAEMLLQDEHDLIHKAVGWMLRELRKMDESSLVSFLNKHYRSMPRTMLRYAIEKFPAKKRAHYMKKSV